MPFTSLEVVMSSLNRRSPLRLLTRRRTSALPIVIVFVLSGCGSSMQVNTDFDRAATFNTMKTYSWREGTPLPNPLMAQRVVDAIDAQLKSKGLTRVDSGGDLTVTYHASADHSVDVQTFSSGGYYSCWGGCMSSVSSTTSVRPVTTGTLVVDLVDTRSNKMIWRGTGSDTVSDNPKENEAKVNEAVKAMFRNYPPKA